MNNSTSVNRFWLFLFLAVLVVVIVGGVYVWLKSTQKSQQIKHNSSASEIAKESWCFVGEDVKGRWCLQVPSDHACDPNRTYESRSACELVEASSMPLGIVQNGGAIMQPLGPMPSMSNTF